MPFQKKLDETDKVIDLVLWYRGLLSIGGLWPTDRRDLKYYTCFVYCFIHAILVFCDFVMVIGYLGPMIGHLRELGLLLIVMERMILLKYSSSLPKLIREDKADEADNYMTDEEKKIYMSYIGLGLRMAKLTIGLTVVSCFTNHFKSFLSYLIAGLFGVAQAPTLPYHTRRFFNTTDTRTYLLLYAYQSPMMYIYILYALSSCFMVSFIYHTCGQLSVLAYRIRNTKAGCASMDYRLELAIRDIIQKHNKIIWTCKTVNGILNLVLYVELIIVSVLLALSVYMLLLISRLVDVFILLSFLLYITVTLLVTYGYCVAGDCITQESINFHDSWYKCEWYDMSPRCKRSIIICMIRAEIPLHVTGGGFYIYNSESFTTLVKSSFAYVSMLRQII